MIDGQAHGPQRGTATCQLHMRLLQRRRHDRRRAVPLAPASRSSRTSSSTARAFDRIIEAGGFITAPTGSAPDANLIAVPKDDADRAMDAAAVHRLRRVRRRLPQRRRPALHRGQARAPEPASPGPAGAPAGARSRMVEEMEQLLRLLHEPPRVLRRVPEGDQHRLHRHAQPRLPEGPSVVNARPDRPPARRRSRRPPRSATASACTATPPRRAGSTRASRALRDRARARAARRRRRRRRRPRRRGRRPRRSQLARELDSLERVQPRVDSWLRVAVGAVADDPGLEPFGEGPTA